MSGGLYLRSAARSSEEPPAWPTLAPCAAGQPAALPHRGPPTNHPFLQASPPPAWRAWRPTAGACGSRCRVKYAPSCELGMPAVPAVPALLAGPNRAYCALTQRLPAATLCRPRWWARWVGGERLAADGLVSLSLPPWLTLAASGASTCRLTPRSVGSWTSPCLPLSHAAAAAVVGAGAVAGPRAGAPGARAALCWHPSPAAAVTAAATAAWTTLRQLGWAQGEFMGCSKHGSQLCSAVAARRQACCCGAPFPFHQRLALPTRSQNSIEAIARLTLCCAVLRSAQERAAPC